MFRRLRLQIVIEFSKTAKSETYETQVTSEVACMLLATEGCQHLYEQTPKLYATKFGAVLKNSCF
jgi:hypothetical protein